MLLLFAFFWMDLAAVQRAARESSFLRLSVRKDRVTARIRRMPLRIVLEELDRHSALRLSLNGSWREYLITADFSDVLFDEVLQRLLSGLSYAIIYESATAVLLPGESEAKRVGELMVFENAPRPRSATARSPR